MTDTPPIDTAHAPSPVTQSEPEDILSAISQNKEIKIQELVRSVPIVSPSMPVLDLMLHMRESRKHMAMVVDEYGGIDGLVTIGDVIESIVGELDDEHDDLDDQPQIVEKDSGCVLADARVNLNDFEARFGFMLAFHGLATPFWSKATVMLGRGRLR